MLFEGICTRYRGSPIFYMNNIKLIHGFDDFSLKGIIGLMSDVEEFGPRENIDVLIVSNFVWSLPGRGQEDVLAADDEREKQEKRDCLFF